MRNRWAPVAGVLALVSAALASPAVASASQAIVLPDAGTVVTTVQSKDADFTLAYGLQSPAGVAVCADCVGGESATLGVFTAGTQLVLYLDDRTVGVTFLSTDPDHARVSHPSAREWIIGWDNSAGDGDFNDLITVVRLQRQHRLVEAGSGTRAATTCPDDATQCTIDVTGAVQGKPLSSAALTVSLVLDEADRFANGNGGFCFPTTGDASMINRRGTNTLLQRFHGTTCEQGAHASNAPLVFQGRYSVTGGSGQLLAASGAGRVTMSIDGPDVSLSAVGTVTY